jgi:RNA polymerase sigma-70 factor (ECF subfamily)
MQRSGPTLVSKSALSFDAMTTTANDYVTARPTDPETLFRENYTGLVRALTVACGDQEAAADAVQDAFIELCLHWKRVSKYDNPVAWVRRVAINRLSNQRRSLHRRAAALLRLGNQDPQSGHEPDFRADLEDALERLPMRQRVAVALYYVEDLPVAEVARSMGISEGSVNTHLHRARVALKPTLEARSCTKTITY